MKLGNIGFVAGSLALLASPAFGATELEVGRAVVLSNGSGDQTPDLDLAAKVKIRRMGNGVLVALFNDGVGDLVFDVKSASERPARDLFVRTCNSTMSDCDSDADWTPAVNISGTAQLSSASTAWQGPAAGSLPFVGDSDKANIFSAGPRVVVTWNDAYCPGGEQRSISYLELDEREIPFSCQYVAVSTNNGATWSAPQQLSDGSRDAKQDVSRGTDAAWVITWQEDPGGLQLGEAEGPGDGASGANVTHGTDIWYTFLSTGDLMAGAPFPDAVRLTNNYTQDEMKQGVATLTESGVAGASRANLALVGSTTIVAYEETKGTGGTDEGKYIRYHVFPYDQPPTSCQPDPVDPALCLFGDTGQPFPAVEDPARMGCILSEPTENARRVRFVTQGSPGPQSAIKLLMFWKQGDFDQGGPSDIVARAGYFPAGGSGGAAGFRPQDLVPAVVAPTASALGDTPDGCLIRGDEVLGGGAFGADLGINLSAATPDGGDLGAGTGDNEIENAIAHRAILQGDFIAVGYSYTPDWAVATYTDLENYDFWLRTSSDGGLTWTDPVDMSTAQTTALAAELGLPPTGVNVREPRLVKPPGNGPACPSGDPMMPDTTNPEHCSAASTFVVAYGTQLNTYEHLGGAEDLDIFITRSLDNGGSYEPTKRLASGDASELESQLAPTPDGRRVFSVWNQADAVGVDAVYAVAVEVEGPDVGTTGGSDTGGASTGDDTGADATTSGGVDGTGSSSGGPDATTGVPVTTSATDGDGDGSSGGGDAGATSSDGGCGCRSTTTPSTTTLLLGLGLLGLGGRRRRGHRRG
jgi:MYXO-CTERM domain-containing protein